MSDTLNTVVETAAAVLPGLLVKSSAVNPNVALVASLAPLALQLLDTATKLHDAGGLTGQQLAGMFKTVGDNIQNTHNAWVAMDAADAAKVG